MNNQISAICVANTQIREINGLYSLADLHKASGGQGKHKPALWLRNQQTNDFIEKMTELQICTLEQNQALSTQAKQALLDDENSLRENIIKIVHGNNGGTYVCKELVVHYGMWISPEFSIKVIQTFLHSQQKATEPVQPAVPAVRPVTIEDLGGLPTRKEIHSLFLLLRDIKKDVEGWGEINFENWVQKNNPRGAVSHQLTYPELVHITRTLHHELTTVYHWHPMHEFMQQPALPMAIAPAAPKTANVPHQLINDASDALWGLHKFIGHADVILNTIKHFMKNNDVWQASRQIELLHDLVGSAENFEADELSDKLNNLAFA